MRRMIYIVVALCMLSACMPTNSSGPKIETSAAREWTPATVQKIHLAQNIDVDGGFKSFFHTGSNVYATWYALQTLALLDRTSEHPAEIIRWVESQYSDGRFIDATRPKDQVAGTFYAVQILKELGATPAHTREIAQALRSLERSQGGFISHADERDVTSQRFGADLLTTYQALQTLQALEQSPASFPATRSWLLGLWQDDKLFPAMPGTYEDTLAPTEVQLLVKSLGLLGVDVKQSPAIEKRQAWLDLFATKWQDQLPQLPHGAGLFDLAALIEIGTIWQRPITIKPMAIEALKAYQTRSGAWSTFFDSMPDDAGTYLAVRILTYAGSPVPHANDLIQSIQLRAEHQGGYLPIVASQSSPHLTYAALFSLATLDQRPLDNSAVHQFVTSKIKSGLTQPEPDAAGVAMLYYALASARLMELTIPAEDAQAWCDRLSDTLHNNIESQIESVAYFLKSARLAQCQITPSFKNQVVTQVQALQQPDGSFGLQTAQPLERAALAVSILHAVGVQPRNPLALTAWIEGYRTPNGGYGTSEDGDLLSTYYAVEAYALLNKVIPEATKVGAWIEQHCKDEDGGYTLECQPKKSSELLSTWWALQTLQRLTRLAPAS